MKQGQTNVQLATPLVSQSNVFVATSCDHIIRLPKFGITCCFSSGRWSSETTFFGWRDDNVRGEEEVVVMEKASEELERRSRYLSSLIQQQKKKEEQAATAAREALETMSLKTEPEMKIANDDDDSKKNRKKKKNVEDEVHRRKMEQLKVRIRACDMSPELQKRAFRCARDLLASMPKLDSKRLALTLKKV